VVSLLAVAVGALATEEAEAAPRTVTLRSGPVVVEGYAVRYGTSRVPAPRVDGHITRMHARVVDRRGRPVPIARMMLHHITFIDKGSPRLPKSDPSYCPERPGRRFYGTGEEDQAMLLPAGYGYRVRARDRWEANWMVMNHGHRVDRVWIQYTMTIDDAPGLEAVTPYWIGVVPCRGDPIFDVPGGGAPGSIHEQAAAWRVPQDGRIVAAGGHIHGGSAGIALQEPACGGRVLVESTPLYGQPDHPYYNVLPVLHEPGPISTSWATSRTGIGVRKGDRLRIVARYDAERLHVRAMGILHVYVAAPRRRPEGAQRCPPPPADLVQKQQKAGGRTVAPAVTVPLTRIGADGRARAVEAPAGRTERVPPSGRYTVEIRRPRFTPPNLIVAAGTRVRWRFSDVTRHDVTVADGPLGFSSQPVRGGTAFERRLTEPGVYKLFCSLHPARMTQRVTVTP
jgi:plastocyanin